MTTGFYWSERCFWHAGGNYAFTLPIGGNVQPLAAGALPENPETKRRLKNLLDVTGLIDDLSVHSAPEAPTEDLLRVHPQSYLTEFKEMSDAGGGELGQRTPFAQGGYELAAQSASLAVTALENVLNGTHKNAYALSRPPGHHCRRDDPMGFCLMANLAIAIEAAKATQPDLKVAVLDWDVHHGNGTEEIFYDRADILTISIHQDRNYPIDTGAFADRGTGKGEGANLNIPLPPGAGHVAYLDTMERLVLPTIRAHAPDIIVIASGFDAAPVDPLGRMMATVETFRAMTRQVSALADEICEGRLMMAHEGGYSEVYVPFCGHAVLQQMSGSPINAPDPWGDAYMQRQPDDAFNRFVADQITAMKDALQRS